MTTRWGPTLGLVVVALAAGFGLGKWRAAPTTSTGQTQTDAPAKDQPASSKPPTVTEDRDDPAPLQLLERCASRLNDARSRLSRCDESPASGDATGQATLDVNACLRHPAVRAACESGELTSLRPDPDEAEAETEAEPPDGSDSAAATDETFARRFATSVVGVGDDESRWLESYMCTVHRLRSQMVDDLGALLRDEASPDRIEALLAEAKQERAAVLADLEENLGPERYQRLRAVGGLGILGSALACDDGA